MPAIRQFRTPAALCLLLTIALLAACAHGPATSPPDTGSARSTAESVLRSVGGADALAGLDNLHFTFVLVEGKQEISRREYWWQRATGAIRMETRDDGEKLIALFNAKTGQGQVFSGNIPKPVEDQKKALARVLHWHAGDSWWLLSVAELADPAAQLKLTGAQMIENTACPTLELSYGPQVPQRALDRYWFHLDPKTSRPLAWSFVLRGQKITPATWLWKDWLPVGNAVLPVRFEQLRRPRVITIEKLYAPGQMNPAILQKP